MKTIREKVWFSPPGFSIYETIFFPGVLVKCLIGWKLIYRVGSPNCGREAFSKWFLFRPTSAVVKRYTPSIYI